MTRITSFPASLLLCVLFLPSAAEGQFRIIPQVGLYASVSDLGTVETTDGVRNVGEQETSLAYGLTLESASDSPLSLRVTGLFGSDSEVPVGGIGCTGSTCDLRSTLLVVSAGAVFRPLPAGSPLRPYALVGGGLKRYDFEFSSESTLDDAFGDESVATWVLGLGFDWDLGILNGNFELADYISDSALKGGDRQHDFFLTLGVILG